MSLRIGFIIYVQLAVLYSCDAELSFFAPESSVDEDELSEPKKPKQKL